MIWCVSYRMKSAKKGIQNRQVKCLLRMYFLLFLSGAAFLPFSSLPLPREKSEREKQKRKNQRKE